MKSFSFTFLSLWLCFSSCKQNPHRKQDASVVQTPSIHNLPDSTSISPAFYQGNTEDPTYHTDTNYEYQYRTGKSGSYTYDYDVEGTDDDGNDVSGDVSVDKQGGSGTLTNSDGDDVDVDVHWTSYGQLEGSDDDGHTYDLHTTP